MENQIKKIRGSFPLIGDFDLKVPEGLALPSARNVVLA